MWVMHFVSGFHNPKYSIWAKSDENLLQNALPTYFSTFQNLRLGSICFSYAFCPRRESATFCSPQWMKTFDKNKSNFMLPKRRIVEGRTNRCVCVFERVFNQW